MAGSGAGRRLRRIDPAYLAALATGAGAFVVYRSTLLPGLGAWDTGEAQTVPPILGTMHPTGFPAYVVLGWLVSTVLAPLGSPAFLMNLMSALLIASAAGLTVLVNRRLGVALLVCVAAAIGFALTPLVWRVGVAADAHALHAVLLVAIVGLLLRWEGLVGDWRESPDDPRLRARADRGIVLAAAVFGVALANHALTLLLIPAVGLFVLAVEPRDRAAARASSWPRWAPASAWRRCCTSSCRSAPASSARRSSTGIPRRGAGSGTSCWPASSRATSPGR